MAGSSQVYLNLNSPSHCLMYIRTDTEIVAFKVATTKYHLNSVIVADSNIGCAHTYVHLCMRVHSCATTN